MYNLTQILYNHQQSNHITKSNHKSSNLISYQIIQIQLLMKSKIQSSKPDIGSNSPLKAKPFPINLSMFQTSHSSSSSMKTYSPLKQQAQMGSKKIANMQPNLFQYNDRSPLLFSSDEDEPSFNYYNQMEETKKENILNSTIVNKQEKDMKEPPKQQVKEWKCNKQQQKMDQKIEEVIINKIYINKSAINLNHSKKQPTKEIHIESSINQLKPSQSQNIMQQQNQSLKQKSQILSKTDQIIEHVNFNENQNILIEQSSHKSSQHSQYIAQSQQPNNRLSYQTTLSTKRKRRNRIFDTNSKNRINYKNQVTPDKGVQTENFHKEIKQFDYSPQLKALDVLSKIVDQINPNPRSSSNNSDFLLPFIDELQKTLQQFKKIKNIDQIGENHLQLIVKTMQRLREMRTKLTKMTNQMKYYSQVDQSIINNFKQLTQQFESIQQVVHNTIETRHRLNNLLQGSKGLMIMLQRKQLKKVYYILQQISIQLQKLRQMKSTCGKYKLENIFRQYLQAEINQLQDMQNSMTASFKDVFPHFKL